MLKHDPREVKQYGKCAAFILAQLRYYAGKGQGRTIAGWACFSLKNWADQIPYSERAICRAFAELEAAGLIEKKNNLDRSTPGYRLPEHRQGGEGDDGQVGEGASPSRQGCIAKVAKVPRQNGDADNIYVLEEKKREEENKTPLPPKGARQATNAKRDLAAIEAAQLPLVDRLTEIINGGRSALGLAALSQSRAAAARTIRQLVEIEQVPVGEIELVCRFMFSPAERKFYSQNLSLIHKWRKDWENGVAFCTARDKWKLSQVPDAPRTTQPQSTNMLDRAYDPTRSTVPGFKEVKL